MTSPIEDRLGIVDVAVAYCEALDRRRFDDLHDVFLPDARVDYGTSVCEGVEAVIDKVRTSIAHLDVTQHLVANHRVALDGDAATHSCYLHAQHVRKGTPGGELYVIAGRYDDRLVRTPAGWRIAERVLTRLWTDGNREVVRR
jgi:SnoaL-like domain